MKKIFLALVLIIILMSVPCVSAKENTHFDLELSKTSQSVVICLKDSNNNPIPDASFDLNISKNGELLKELKHQRLNDTAQREFYLRNGEIVVDVIFHGDDNYNPTSISKHFSISKSKGNSLYYYYDSNNYGSNLKMDERIYDKYWDDEIYDDASNYDGEWY